MTERIKNILSSGQSILLVSNADEGKTWFLKNELIPALECDGFNVDYLEDPDIEAKPDCDFYIIDEVEVLADQKFLEALHPEESPFYEPRYLEKVAGWHKKLAQIKKPCVYALTRNDEEAILNILETVKRADWDGRELITMNFKRN